MPDLSDRRVQKTRQILQKAIMELIVEKGFESLTVQDILDRANVGRSTFYAHYQDKEELMHSCFEELHKTMEQQALNLFESQQSQSNSKINTGFILKILKFAEENRQLLKALLMQEELSESIKNSLYANLYEPFKKRLAREKNITLPPEIIAQYFMNAFFGTFKWWITRDAPYTAEEIDGYIQKLAMPTFKSLQLMDI